MPRKKGRGRRKAKKTAPSAIVKAVEQEAKKVAEKVAKKAVRKVAKKEAKKVAKRTVRKVAKKEAKKEARKEARKVTRKFKKQLLNKWMKNIKKGKTYIYYAVPHQLGESKRSRDIKLKALPPGKRKSKSGKTYYEYRRNRSDKLGTML